MLHSVTYSVFLQTKSFFYFCLSCLIWLLLSLEAVLLIMAVTFVVLEYKVLVCACDVSIRIAVSPVG